MGPAGAAATGVSAQSTPAYQAIGDPDAVQHAEVRSRWFGGSARCGHGERRPIVAAAIAEGQRLEPAPPTWRPDAGGETGRADPAPAPAIGRT
jgi:hypothetical protein